MVERRIRDCETDVKGNNRDTIIIIGSSFHSVGSKSSGGTESLIVDCDGNKEERR